MHRKSLEAAEQLKSDTPSENTNESSDSSEDNNNQKKDFSVEFPNNLIRRHSSVASLRAKAQQHMTSLGIRDEEEVVVDEER